MREKFQVGITGLPYTSEARLNKILGFHEAHIGTSNFTYLVDVIVGALRYAVNEKKNPEAQETCKEILSQLKPMFLGDKEGKIHEVSCFFSPKIIKSKKYLEEYTGLHQFLAEHGIVCMQIPTNERTY